MTRALLRLTLDCDNRCRFCAQLGVADPPIPAAGWQVRLAELRPTAAHLTVVGGEPTLVEALVDVVAAARDLGFTRIGLQTNGRRLARGDLAGRLAAAGLDHVHLSIHGGHAAVHDYHTGVDGSFAEVTAAIAAIRAAGLAAVATSLVTRSSFRVLPKIAALVASQPIAAWTLALPRARGRAADSFDRLIPRLGLAVPFALHAIAAARAVGVPAWIRGAPACVLGDYAHRALASRPRRYPPGCDRCAARPFCPGVSAAYLQRYGSDELTRLDRPAALATDHPELADCFVGTGALGAGVDLGGLPPSPAQRRELIPGLGKPRPAVDERPGRSPTEEG